MPVSRRRLKVVGRAAMWVANGAVALALVATGALVVMESGWARPTFRAPAEAFRHGTIGTEVMPLPVAAVLPDMFPEHFRPAGPEAGDWMEQFGFLPDPDDPHGLPVGFEATNYRPRSAAPSPVPFVALTCALCHTTELTLEGGGGEPVRVTGPGSVSLNLFAWLDAFQAAILDRAEPADPAADPGEGPYRLTAGAVDRAWRERTGEALSPAERLMVALWLVGIRRTIEEGVPRFDAPWGEGRSREEAVTPTGPTRTLAFRTLLRRVLGVPANALPIHSKIATVFNQGLRERAQFDGSIADLHARSSLAAFAAGATVDNLAHPEIAHNIRAAIAYTLDLSAPPFEETFPNAPPLDAAAAARGRAVYRAHCFSCHGDADGAGGWEKGPRTGEVIPLAEIGTDPERVMFRHYERMPRALHALFPEGHPFAFDRAAIFPEAGEELDLAIRGYLAGPIDGAYLRAPFLHNGSVMTLAELVNLEPRRDVFFRGWNAYDGERLGLASPPAPDARRYFRFDAALPGNANAGHDYPWAFDDPARDPAALGDLLAYLRTL